MYETQTAAKLSQGHMQPARSTHVAVPIETLCGVVVVVEVHRSFGGCHVGAAGHMLCLITATGITSRKLLQDTCRYGTGKKDSNWMIDCSHDNLGLA